VNRNIIGAVVGVQPLARFATEQTETINTAAAGGNASLIAIGAWGEGPLGPSWSHAAR